MANHVQRMHVHCRLSQTAVHKMINVCMYVVGCHRSMFIKHFWKKNY